MDKLKDIEIIKKLKGNDKQVVDSIYQHYHKRIFAFALSLIKVEDDALDIVHEVFVKIWEHRHNLENDSRIEPLIFTITRNTVLSKFRKKANERKYQEQMFAANYSAYTNKTEEDIDYKTLKEKVDTIVTQLPPKSQKVFILSREKGFSNKEIANQLNIAEKTVEDHITRALSFLKQNLKESGFLGILFWYLFIG